MALDNQLAEGEALKLNNDSPSSQLVQLGSLVKEVQDNIAPGDLLPLLSFEYEIIADATTAVTIITSIPIALRLVDVIVEATATSASGTVTIQNGAAPITNAIVMDTDTTITRAGTIDNDEALLVVGDSVTVITNGTADRGIVTLVFRKV